MTPVSRVIARARSLLGEGGAIRRPDRGFERRRPSKQTAHDVFRGEWWSRFPPPLEQRGGSLEAFADPRIAWAIERLGVDGADVLELGPLEGGHSFMLERSGARSVTSIEANRRAYLRCLVAQQVVGLERTTFLCGDALEFLRGEGTRFDVCVASGILYHLLDPVDLIALLAQRADRLFIWTHYHGGRGRSESRRFSRPVPGETAGFAHSRHPRSYSRVGRRLARFPGGANPSASWLSRADLLGALDHFGWGDVEVAFDEPGHPGGPALALVARRAGSQAASR